MPMGFGVSRGARSVSRARDNLGGEGGALRTPNRNKRSAESSERINWSRWDGVTITGMPTVFTSNGAASVPTTRTPEARTVVRKPPAPPAAPASTAPERGVLGASEDRRRATRARRRASSAVVPTGIGLTSTLGG